MSREIIVPQVCVRMMYVINNGLVCVTLRVGFSVTHSQYFSFLRK